MSNQFGSALNHQKFIEVSEKIRQRENIHLDNSKVFSVQLGNSDIFVKIVYWQGKCFTPFFFHAADITVD